MHASYIKIGNFQKKKFGGLGKFDHEKIKSKEKGVVVASPAYIIFPR
jgi:hypothetical protein